MGRKWWVLVCVFALLAAACQSPDTEDGSGALPVDEAAAPEVAAADSDGDSVAAGGDGDEALTVSTNEGEDLEVTVSGDATEAGEDSGDAEAAPVLRVGDTENPTSTPGSSGDGGSAGQNGDNSGTTATTSGTQGATSTTRSTTGSPSTLRVTTPTTSTATTRTPTTRTATTRTVTTLTATTRTVTTQTPTTRTVTTQTPTTRTVTTRPVTTQPPSTQPPTTRPPVGNLLFSEDFRGGGWTGRIDTGLFHRDDSVVAQSQWVADHQSTGPNDLCGPPEEKRTVNRGSRSGGFNNDWLYRCVPGGDLAKAHIMTSIGDTSGYSIGAFSPSQSFTGVREVRWDVNQTDLGDRQWTEMAIIPASQFSFQNLPCTADVPCGTTNHDVIGSVGTQWGGQRVRVINTPQNSYTEASGGLGYRCSGCPYATSKRFGMSYGVGDSALTSIRIRKTNFFRDNGNGTLTWGLQMENGSFEEFTAPGSFPSGPVRVVFKDHNYTPMKSPATLISQTTFTWHWDNIGIYN